MSLQNVPPDLSICTFVLEQSLSVRALQEMLANTEEKHEGVSTWGFLSNIVVMLSMQLNKRIIPEESVQPLSVFAVG